jgi:glycosyltransferase involved in cell wall biosynthesis
MPKFSVAIAVYNKEQHIAKTLESVLAQTFTDFEIIIVNDGSTDGSEAIIKSFDDNRIHYFSQENQGAAAGRNAAIKNASTKYIALLDADDFWFPHYLEEQNRLIKKYPNEFIFATAQEIIKNNKSFPKPYSLPKGFEKEGILNYFEASSKASILHSSSTVLKKEVFDEVGYYDHSIKIEQDTDLYIRLGLKYPVVFSNRICSSYYIIENSLFRSANSLDDKEDFSSYSHLEADNPPLKKFLDLNRFSLAIFAKLKNDREGFKRNFEKIDLSNLNKKQRLLLRLSPKSTRFLYSLKNFFERFGIRLSAFK